MNSIGLLGLRNHGSLGRGDVGCRETRPKSYRKWKRGGGCRVIEPPSDRVKTAQRLILSGLSSQCHTGVQKALREFQKNIEEGFHWVAALDIRDCFPHINPRKPLAMIDTRITDGVPGLYGSEDLPQGHPISSYLANLYLSEFDRKVAPWHIPAILSDSTTECRVIRYVDNIWLMCRRKNELALYLSRSLRYLGDMGLKTRHEVKHVNEGIDFLGHTITRWSIGPNPRNVQRFKERTMTYALTRKALVERLKNAVNAEAIHAKIFRLDKDYNGSLYGWEAFFGPAMREWLSNFLHGFNSNRPPPLQLHITPSNTVPQYIQYLKQQTIG